MTTTHTVTLSLEDWLTMTPVLDRVLSAPYADIPGSVESARRLIRVQRLIDRARDDSGLEPITTSLAKQFGDANEKTQRYDFPDAANWARYVAGRRAIADAEVTIEVPLLAARDISILLSAAERAVIAPLFA